MSDLSESPQEVADRLGLDLVLPGPLELQIDLDSPDDHVVLTMMRELLAKNGELVEEVKRTTSAGGNTHVTLKMPAGWGELSPLLRVALQACLGSDRKREVLSILRIVRTYDMPATCFFEKRDGAVPGLSTPVEDAELSI